MRTIKIYFRLLGINIRTVLEFKADFFLMLFSGVLSQILGLAFIWILFNNIPHIAGWDKYQIIFLLALVYLSEGIASTFFEGTWSLPDNVNSGRFDRLLIRPVSPMIQIFTLGFGTNGLSNIILSVYLLYYSLSFSHINWTFYKIFILIVLIVLGVGIRVLLNLLSSCSAFWIKKGSPLVVISLSLVEFAKYPLSIYSFPVKVILFIIPYSFVSFVPAAYIFDKGLWSLLAIVSPIMFVLVFLLTKFTLSCGISRYESTGY